MMRLSAMWRLVSTVEEDGSCPAAEEILRPWGYDPGSVRFFRASANFVCHFKREGRPYFLRFNTPAERSGEMVEAEVRFVTWLAAQGMPVAAPVASQSGRLVERVETDLGPFHAVVFTGLEGGHHEMAECGPAEFRAWGAALGRLHAAAKGYQDPSRAHRPTWRDHLALARSYIPPGHRALEREWERLTAWGESLPTGADDFGLIHFDFESDNLCWQGDTISILDFDDCAHHWYVADIAYALRDLFDDGVDLENPLFREFVAGYQEIHPLNPDLLGEIPMFLRLHELYRFGRLSRALDLPAGQEVPVWLQRLDAKLGGYLKRYQEAL